jgi:CD36 family
MQAVEGLNPDKEKHQFFVDVAPEFGFPLAIRSVVFA